VNVKIFLVGEGKNELGSRVGDPSYQSDESPGVLHALLMRIEPAGWEVGGARDWKNIRKFKFKAGRAAHADTHNVLGAALDAKEAGCDVLAFMRDRDKDHGRKEAVDEGIRRVPATLSSAPEVIGGVAVPKLEAWILALLQHRKTELLSPTRAEEVLAEKGIAAKDGLAMVRVVEQADLKQIPKDATSLNEWVARAESVLPAMVARRAGA